MVVGSVVCMYIELLFTDLGVIFCLIGDLGISLSGYVLCFVHGRYQLADQFG